MNNHADFTPTMKGYTGQGAFRFWCQKVLPLVYDDSLSYYEVLCRVVDYLNNTIADVANVETNVQSLYDAYNLLQGYVNTYFDNLDVQNEINNKLDSMANNGELSALISPFVTSELPGVVENQIDGVVAEQIDEVVSEQIDDSVARQIVAAASPTVEEWLTENVNPVGSAVVIDESLSISGAAADAKVTGSKISNIKYGVISQIQLINFNTITSGKMIANDGTLIDSSSSFVTDYIKVTQGDHVAIVMPRNICAYDDDKSLVTGSYTNVDNPREYTYYTVPTNAKYIRITGYNNYKDVFTANFGNSALPKEQYYKTDKLQDEINIINRIKNGQNKQVDTLSSGETLSFSENNINNNIEYYFSASISSLSQIKIGHGTGNVQQSYIDIDTTNVTVHSGNTADAPVVHGLTFSGYIEIILITNETDATLIIASGNNSFVLENFEWRSGGNASDFVTCVTGNLTDCIFAVNYPDLAKEIWLFGDSYINYTNPERWAYYLRKFGQFKNVMISGYSGQGSITAIPALKEILKLSEPKIIIWAIGMNDGSDSGTTPVNRWNEAYTELVKLQEYHSFELILCTIPTTPTVNNNGKNSIIESSNFRYIDFAKAVGADGTGAWYSGMLATDDTHTRIPGAIALYNVALQTVPEMS